MVQVGYKYYSQCYDLKKKKQEELYPTKDGKLGKSRLSPQSVDPSMVNVRNAEIYLDAASNGGPRKRGPASKRKKPTRGASKN